MLAPSRHTPIQPAHAYIAVEPMERADRHAGELTLQVGGEAAFVAPPEAAVLVELKDRGLAARELAADRVRAQGGVDAERRAPGRQEHAQARPRAARACARR